MDITCNNCQSRFKIADDKLPPGKLVNLRCPKCKEKITVEGPPPQTTIEMADTSLQPQVSLSEPGFDTYDAADKPFDFIEEEGKTALICESDPGIKDTVNNTLTALDYHITHAENARDALKKMRYHNYDLILLNEQFDTADPDRNGVLVFIERLGMSVRRDMFVILISNRFRTMDNMQAFNKSVNIIINTSNIRDFDKILSRGLTDNDYFYRVFKEMMRKTGRS